MPMIGEGFREWFEAPSYEEGVGVVGKMVPSLGKEGRVVVKRKLLNDQVVIVDKDPFGRAGDFLTLQIVEVRRLAVRARGDSLDGC